jgi:hypothetical protein
MQVRGTPASGKTTLLTLLHSHIISQDSEAVVDVIKSWPKITHQDTIQSRLHHRIGTKSTYLLFDNGQDAYWDSELWDVFFKDVVQKGNGPLVVLFCSYGSPTARPLLYNQGAPLKLNGCAHISLQTSDCIDNERQPHPPCSLLFSKTEFEEVLQTYENHDASRLLMDDSLQDMLFDWTNGHAGGVVDLLSLLSQRVCCVCSHLAISYIPTETQGATRGLSVHCRRVL